MHHALGLAVALDRFPHEVLRQMWQIRQALAQGRQIQLDDPQAEAETPGAAHEDKTGPVTVHGMIDATFMIGLCVAVVAGFHVVVIAAQQLGNISRITPALAAWLPLMIFVPLAAAVSKPLSE